MSRELPDSERRLISLWLNSCDWSAEGVCMIRSRPIDETMRRLVRTGQVCSPRLSRTR